MMNNSTSAPFEPLNYPEHSVSRLMEPPIAVFLPTLTVGDATEIVRDLAAGTRVFTYGYIVDATGVLVGVVTMRDLLLHSPEASLEDIMLKDPFSLSVNDTVIEAIRSTVQKHYPSYPVCDDRGDGGRRARFEIVREAGHRDQRAGRRHGRYRARGAGQYVLLAVP